MAAVGGAAMCTDTGLGAAAAAPVAGLERQEEWAGQTIALETVEALSILTVCDNVVDILLPDGGPARHLVGAAALGAGGVGDAPVAQHGLSVRVTVTRGGATHRLLFDCGVTP